MKLGVLGGTFNPVHEGHLAAAAAARDALQLERVLFVPAGDPWLRAGEAIAPGAHRRAMVEAAIAHNPAYAVSTVDLDRAGPTYTVDTLDDLQAQYGPAARLHFIMGADALRALERWHDPAAMLSRCTLVVLLRPAQGNVDLSPVERILPEAAARAVVVPLDVAVSATEVRRRAAAGLPLAGLTPPTVERYIREHGLYKEE